MPGFTHDRLCKHLENCDPAIPANSYRGQCGGCRGECQPCADDGSNCGEWQECTCVAGACGDGHSCKRYIDITFTVKEFVIQGQACCSGSPALTQPCGGALENNETPISGNPSGWGVIDGGVQTAITYQETTHNVRLVKSSPDAPYCAGGQTGSGGTSQTNCDCFWGGYWTSSCDCSNCCCADPSTTYPVCACTAMSNPTGILVCQGSGGTSEPCDPANPCVPTNNGYASSLDSWGLENPDEQGGADGQGLCVTPALSGVNDPCGVTTSACDSYGDASYACWECGNFKKHHIEAYMTMETSPTTCDTAWILEIRGLTEQARGKMGHSNSSLDCIGLTSPGTCDKVAGGGSGDPALAYRGRWWGKSSTCNNDCEDGSFDAQPELSAFGCTCPPHTTFESTVRVSGALGALHPTAIYGGPTPAGQTTGAGQLYTCVAPSSWCGTAAYLALHPETAELNGTYYGAPEVWWESCDYCAACCDTNWSTGCSGCRTCSPCDCPPPVPLISTDGIPDPVHPCSHCGDTPSLNDPDCQPCPETGESHMCAEVVISIVPNNNPLPQWQP